MTDFCRTCGFYFPDEEHGSHGHACTTGITGSGNATKGKSKGKGKLTGKGKGKGKGKHAPDAAQQATMNNAMQMQEARIKKANEKKRKSQEEQAAASAAKVGPYLAQTQYHVSSTHCVSTRCVSTHCVCTHFTKLSLSSIGCQTFKWPRRPRRWSQHIKTRTMVVAASYIKTELRKLRDSPIRRRLKPRDLGTKYQCGINPNRKH